MSKLSKDRFAVMRHGLVRNILNIVVAAVIFVEIILVVVHQIILIKVVIVIIVIVRICIVEFIVVILYIVTIDTVCVWIGENIDKGTNDRCHAEHDTGNTDAYSGFCLTVHGLTASGKQGKKDRQAAKNDRSATAHGQKTGYT